MELLKILDPFTPFSHVNEPKLDFSSLTLPHRIITVIAVGIVTLMGVDRTSYFHELIGRFRKLEIGEVEKPETMSKVEKKGQDILKSEPVKPTVPNPESIPKKETGNENFWKEFYTNKNLQHYLEKAALKNDPEKAADDLIGYYLALMLESNPDFNLNENESEEIRKALILQLQQNQQSHTDDIESDMTVTHELPDDKLLVVYNTVGDGSCGLHALLGKPDENGQYRCNIVEARNEFCDWLEECHANHMVPEAIQNTLEDYFLHFENAPDTFQVAVLEKYQEYKALHKDLNLVDNSTVRRNAQEIQDQVVTAFTDDKEVFKAYIDNLRKVGTYLLQEEMIAAALCFDIKLDLFQPGWGANDAAQIQKETINAIASGDTVSIWYNGINHYERAAVI